MGSSGVPLARPGDPRYPSLGLSRAPLRFVAAAPSRHRAHPAGFSFSSSLLFPPSLFIFLLLFFFYLYPSFFLFFSLFLLFPYLFPSPLPNPPFSFSFLPLHCKKSSLTKALSPHHVTASDSGMQRTPISLPYPIHTQPVSSPRVCGEEEEESISKVSAVACQSSWQGCRYALKGTQDL